MFKSINLLDQCKKRSYRFDIVECIIVGNGLKITSIA